MLRLPRSLPVLFVGLACMVLQACAVQSLRAEQFAFQDGQRAIYFDIDKAGRPGQKNAGQLENLVFVVSGSDCISMGPFLPQYFTGLGEESGSTKILIMHKRHILPGSNGHDCGQAYVRDDHLSRWQQDQQEFIAMQLAALKKTGIQVKRIILFGISEGAELAPLLVRQASATHLVLLSHSGLNALDAYRSLASHHAHMQQGWLQLQAAMARQPDDQEASRIHGRSWRYWSEIATVTQQQNLFNAGLPVFLAAGQADPVIIQTAISDLQQSFLASGKPIRIALYPDADHGLNSPAKNYLPDFMHQVDNWLVETMP
ncbi:prolyl oligopeptidase family serine peptidase [Undibacterium sp. TS12]|uniref:alpha/beta hydrolase family protein n=1 Tax=Undibacterium sp. TS12 TaxID=2908202 RepID=UPI001F4C6346|nr:prolyl oligopeptidase family serine peptidase [Undibacterium sp. TS12]MCH8622054.1 prolyl oligopeptidase family serine peptidase [Undibacterium sp. TS12]